MGGGSQEDSGIPLSWFFCCSSLPHPGLETNWPLCRQGWGCHPDAWHLPGRFWEAVTGRDMWEASTFLSAPTAMKEKLLETMLESPVLPKLPGALYSLIL